MLAISPAFVLAFAGDYILRNYTSIQNESLVVVAPIIGIAGYILLIVTAILAWSLWEDAKHNVIDSDSNDE